LNILLINPPWIIRKSNIWSGIAGVIPPLGLAQIAAYLEESGICVSILDARADELDAVALRGKLKSLDFRPAFIGITATTSIITQAIETARISNDVFPEAKIVFGGVHPTIFPEEVLSNGFVDYVIRREGEISFSALISGKPPQDIPGLSYKQNGKVINNPDGPEIPDIDKLPFPAYHLLPMHKYHPTLGSYKQLPGTGIITTRGCPGRCTFCFGNYLGNRVRMRSADKILEEIRLLNSNYNIKEIAFYDDTFTAVKSNVMKFCGLMIESKLGITWSCFARVDFIDESLLMLMKKAGCHQICFGVESGCTEILDNIKKKISLEKAVTAVKLTKKCGIEARTTFMLGNPGETEETLKKTLDFAISLDPDIVLFNITTPFPGTEMYEWADKNKYLRTKDWSKYDFSQPLMDLPGMEADKLELFYKYAYRKFYSRPSYLLKWLFRMTNAATIVMVFKAVIAIFGVVMNSNKGSTAHGK
jgi:radical SAM superfamily enzyme YgiQ (UPF0313 family)